MPWNYVATSRCECQAILSAKLTPERFVVRGSAFRSGKRETAPAHAIGAEADRFDVGWLCPFCGRNTMRCFFVDALQKVEVAAPPPPAEAPTDESSAQKAAS